MSQRRQRPYLYKNNRYDLYFSACAAALGGHAVYNIHGLHHRSVTEVVRTGRKPLSKWEDLKLVARNRTAFFVRSLHSSDADLIWQ